MGRLEKIRVSAVRMTLLLSFQFMACIQEPMIQEPREKPILDKPVYSLDSGYFDTGQFIGDFAPVAVGNRWKYAISGVSRMSKAYPAISSTNNGFYSYEILSVDTPYVSIRLMVENIVSVSRIYPLETITTTDTISIDSTFSIVDSSNTLHGWGELHDLPLYYHHYAKRDLDSSGQSARTKVDAYARKLQYSWFVAGGGTLTSTYSADIGLISSVWVGSGNGGGGIFERVLVESNIKIR